MRHANWLSVLLISFTVQGEILILVHSLQLLTFWEHTNTKMIRLGGGTPKATAALAQDKSSVALRDTKGGLSRFPGGLGHVSCAQDGLWKWINWKWPACTCLRGEGSTPVLRCGTQRVGGTRLGLQGGPGQKLFSHFLTFLNCWFISEELKTASLWSWGVSTLCWHLWDWLVFSNLPFRVEICSPNILKHPHLLRATTSNICCACFLPSRHFWEPTNHCSCAQGCLCTPVGRCSLCSTDGTNGNGKVIPEIHSRSRRGKNLLNLFGALCLLNNELLFLRCPWVMAEGSSRPQHRPAWLESNWSSPGSKGRLQWQW